MNDQNRNQQLGALVEVLNGKNGPFYVSLASVFALVLIHDIMKNRYSIEFFGLKFHPSDTLTSVDIEKVPIKNQMQ